jgi:predicted lipoprotein with Yx(FWY)xxD motif
MRATRILTSAVLFSVAAYGLALAADAPAGVKMAGGMLQDGKGMTLYTWDNDKEANKSSCNAMCAANWPALKADAGAKDMGEWKVITRDDGSKQWAYKGKPLYYFVMDSAAGDKKGEGRGMVWHMAKM